MLEVADIFRAAGAAFRDKFGARMLPSHLKVIRDILQCRTPALGGHLLECDSCGERRYSYHSCRNRHCPKCQGDRSSRWVEAQKTRILNCPYFLLTFTLPSELRPVARSHQREVYGNLMRAAAQSLQKLAADPRYLGARPGIIGILHTWTRAMLYHPHVHLLVTAGGLTEDGEAWRDTKNPSFLVPCRALSVIFRAKLRDALEKAGLTDGLRSKLWRRKWVVHCQHAGSGEKVLDYLGRYLHRVAIANSRLESFESGLVTFRYRNRQTGETTRCTLEAEDFIARFLQHVLPRGLAKVRSWGLYSPSCKPALERARGFLGERTPQVESCPARDHDTSQDHATAPEEDPICPSCEVGRLKVVATLLRISAISGNARAPP